MKKIAKEFEYDGLGFPIILLNVPLIEIRGIEVPDIDYNQLQRCVLLGLCQMPVPLTGNQVRFIRQYYQMNNTEFSKYFGVTHASVIHWERAGNEFAKILPATELCIRLSILDMLNAKDKIFRQTFREFNFEDIKKRKLRDNHNYLILDSQELIA